jgi:hypothetical protein
MVEEVSRRMLWEQDNDTEVFLQLNGFHNSLEERSNNFILWHALSGSDFGTLRGPDEELQ